MFTWHLLFFFFWCAEKAAANGGEVFDVATRKAPVNTLFSLQSERVQAYNVFHE